MSTAYMADGSTHRSGDEPLYNVFVRNWWRRTGPNTREPGAGPKRYQAKGVSYAEARRLCAE